MKRPAIINNGAAVLRKAFRARKVFGTFEKFKVLEIEAFGRTWTIEVISIDVEENHVFAGEEFESKVIQIPINKADSFLRIFNFAAITLI